MLTVMASKFDLRLPTPDNTSPYCDGRADYEHDRGHKNGATIVILVRGFRRGPNDVDEG